MNYEEQNIETNTAKFNKEVYHIPLKVRAYLKILLHFRWKLTNKQYRFVEC